MVSQAQVSRVGYLRIRAMVVSATSTDSSSGSSWMPFGNRMSSITTVSSLVSVLYSRTLRMKPLALENRCQAFNVTCHKQEVVITLK